MVGRELHRHCHLLLFSRYPYWMAIPTIDEIVQLSPAERLYLIGQLWDSLEQQDLPLSQGQEAELNRRLDSIEQDRNRAIAWTDLKSKLEQHPP